ncbi:hypothetical protein INR75_17650 [Zunongwangia sp. SCSIO 43204]|uniref:hypothetical protein n=1 Tax=Zunongwangia sp. SCSIO 43204 TaxID=2779359 RepID=UPI001CA99E1D|nr:hypothetical protein [Zunongwangia sp. SCSIO 43204]UAB83974.1 hypothetical protein INR75_17650 [Zunongwangia sp. SCSIO 43204]
MNQDLSHRIKFHKIVSPFNHDITVDWAIELLKNGFETDNIYMLASFSKPVDSEEIKNYVSAVLNDLGIPEAIEEEKDDPVKHIQHFMEQIIAKNDIYAQLKQLYELFLSYNEDYGLDPFSLVYYSWENFLTENETFYAEASSLKNLENWAVEESHKWMSIYVYKDYWQQQKTFKNLFKKIWTRLFK